ncbi:helix-turn-helix domain-containing protein [Patescibacteria group bacterium]|nr:helix-turn-helix domain-containing protein [Patescibacteria group bacterium]
MAKKVLTSSEVAKILGISRVAVFKKIKSGQIKAIKIGRNFVIEDNDLMEILGKSLSEKDKKNIEESVKKTIKEYGETLRLLGKE